MSAAVGWAVEALLASTLLMALVLAVRRPVQRAIGPQLAYWLWALPALRLILPPLPAAWREAAALPIAGAGETMLVWFEPVASGTPVGLAGPAWSSVAIAIWLGGAAAFFAWHAVAHARYVAQISAASIRRETQADGIVLVTSAAATGPVAFGVIRRFVAVPADFAALYDADERRLALAHEISHHARGDLIANWFALGGLALHWFNPLGWCAYRRFRADQELANDARVLADLPATGRHAYACAIVKAAHGRAVTPACHLHTIEDLKGRLRMLTLARTSRRMALAGATGIVTLTVAGLGLTASGAAAERLRTAGAAVLPALAQAVPAVPPTPPVAEPARPATGTTRRVSRVVVTRDGKTDRYEGAQAEAYLAAHPELTPPLPPPAPAIAAANAPQPPRPPQSPAPGSDVQIYLKRPGDAGPVRIESLTRSARVVTMTCDRNGSSVAGSSAIMSSGPGQVTVCTDRLAGSAAVPGDATERYAVLNALRGLRQGRAAVISNPALTEAQRKQALDGIDTALKSLTDELSPAR